MDNLIDPSQFEVSRVRSVATAICRRWLIDNGLTDLARTLGVVPTLPVIDVRDHVKIVDKWDAISFYTAGGVSLNGWPINSIYKLRGGFPGRPEFPIPPYKTLHPGKFLRRRCTYGLNTWFTVEDVMRHMANKAGGVHFDTKRGKVVDQKIDDVRARFLIGSELKKPEQCDAQYIGIKGTFEEKFDLCYLEMMSIAQSLCNVRFDDQPVVHKIRIGSDHAGFGEDVLLGHTHHRRVKL
ncbi:conserved hypothetical protein [Rhodobacteraceae bacterium KLH11]|nr:conserved hypothetical protein [Rhodobacteraceae bacterium KLH11]